MEASVAVTNTLWLGQKGHWNKATVQKACFPLPKENGKEQATTTGRSLQAQLLRSPTSLPFTEPARSSPARKQRKTLGWWWSYQEPIPCQWQTLSHTAVNSKTSRRVARSSPARKQRKTLGWWWPKKHTCHLCQPTRPQEALLPFTSMQNQSKSSAIQLQTGVFSNFPIWTSVIVLECKYTSLSSKTSSIYKK